MYVGVGIGGTFDTCALLAKKALAREIGSAHPRKDVADIEKKALEKINALGIGAQGFGGKTTALGVACEIMPTHIAGLPWRSIFSATACAAGAPSFERPRGVL